MAKNANWRRKNRKWEKCFKYDKEEYIAKDCKEMQSIKSAKVHEESDNEDREKGQGFGNDLE